MSSDEHALLNAQQCMRKNAGSAMHDAQLSVDDSVLLLDDGETECEIVKGLAHCDTKTGSRSY